MNVDVYEGYLLRVSGRALAATQHLNMTLISSFVADMKIFDDQSPIEVTEEQMEEQLDLEIEAKRQKRRTRRRRAPLLDQVSLKAHSQVSYGVE